MTDLLPQLQVALADRYRIERELGAGGMATVYLADDLRHERKVAVKVLRPELAASIGPERFLREIRIAAQLQHPHILPLHESGEADGFLYYVMPYVDGESLRSRLTRSGELPVHEAVRLVIEVVDALAYAHSRGVVHRDIKPDNVMLSGRHALVMDFGVAKAVSEASGRGQLTSAGIALGTPAYMAPEQAAADPHLDHRVDIYAVGVMAFELLAGRPPFVGGSPQQVLAAHVTQAPEPLSKFRPGISPALEQVVMRCLAKRPADRWQTADELMSQLETVLTPSGGMTPTSTRPIASWQPGSSRRKWLLGAAALGILAFVALWARSRSGDGASLPLVLPEIRQLTATGNADFAALSPDSTRLAYTIHHCEADGRCTSDLVIQDINGAGADTLVRGPPWLYRIEWTADQRYLLFGADWGPGRYGEFVVPTLGGQPRFLGCCDGGLLGNGDTVLIGRPVIPGDSTGWIQFVTVGDGVAHDSLLFHRRLRTLLPSPDGRWIGLVTWVGSGIPTLYLMSRAGRITDSTSWPANGFAWTPDSRNILRVSGNGNGVTGSLIRYPLSGDRLSITGDTLLRQLPSVNWWNVSRTGILTYSSGPTQSTVWALRRASLTTMQFTSQSIASASGGIVGQVSPDGSRVLVSRAVPPDMARYQVSIIPFAGGAELQVGAPSPGGSLDWHPDGSRIILMLGQDSIKRVFTIDPITGRKWSVGAGRSNHMADFMPLPSGGIVVTDPSQKEFRLWGTGGPDTLMRVPPEIGRVEYVAGSPDGSYLITVGWNPTVDSTMVARVSRSTGAFTRIATFAGAYARNPPFILPDGTLQIGIRETAREQTMIWYRLYPSDGRSVRMGPAPYYPAWYSMSADGLHVLATAFDSHADIYEIRNFAEMLKR